VTIISDLYFSETVQSPEVVASLTIYLRSVNDPPSLTMPSSSILCEEDQSAPLHGLSIVDVDSFERTDLIRVNLTVAFGRVQVKPVKGVQFVGNSDGVLRIACPLAVCNDVLSKALYVPRDNWSGEDVLEISVEDFDGGVAKGSISVKVAAVNDPPVISTPSKLVVFEDSVAEVKGIEIADADLTWGSADQAVFSVNIQCDSGAIAMKLTEVSLGLSETAALNSHSITIVDEFNLFASSWRQ
jgi:hypothetical protein